MHLFRETILLFSLNLLDALLTIVWVRNGAATEANLLMAKLLDIGDIPFIGVKVLIGAFAALVLLRWGNRQIARYGVAFALVVYIGVMAIHLITGLSALGLIPESLLIRLATA